jgi:hypothetical protein
MAVIVLSWSMDRLESLSINPYTIPGLVPGLLGAGLVVFGAVLGIRAWRTPDAPEEEPLFPRGALVRIGIVGGLCFLFAAGALGRGVPFWATAGAFVFAVSFAIDRMTPDADPRLARAVVRAALVAAIVTALVTLVFERLLLLRLP